MPSPKERKVMHLANIGNYLHDLVKVMEAMNKNLVEIGKILKESDESYEQIVSGKGPMMVPRGCDCSPNYCCCSDKDRAFADDKPLEDKRTPYGWMEELGRTWFYHGEPPVRARELLTREEFLELMNKGGTETTKQVPARFEDLDEKLPCGCTVRDHKFGEHLEGE
jgi:hypothetical protein